MQTFINYFGYKAVAPLAHIEIIAMRSKGKKSKGG
jgi:hypothetical protein